MVDVAEELGVDAIGLNHLMFSTPEEVRRDGPADRRRPTRRSIATFVTADPGLDVARVREQGRARSQQKCRERNVLFDYRPKVHPPADRELLHARARSSRAAASIRSCTRACRSRGKVYFCPFIRVEVGDLTTSSLEEVWNGERYVDMRKRLLEQRHLPGLPPLLQGRAVAGAGRRCRRPSRRSPRDAPIPLTVVR